MMASDANPDGLVVGRIEFGAQTDPLPLGTYSATFDVVSVADLQREVKRLTREITNLRSENVGLKNWLSSAERERDEARALLSPEVQAAAEYIKRNADAHPHACCAKCAMAMTERDEARAEIANLQRGIEAYRAKWREALRCSVSCKCIVCAWEREQREEGKP